MINSKNGSLNLKEFELLPFSKFELTDQFKKANIQEVRDFNNGWKWLDIINLKIDDRYFNFSLGYFDDRLNQVLMTFKDSGDKSTWNDWSKEIELKNQEKFKKWLKKEVGDKRVFNWGNINSAYDIKAGFSFININYKTLDGNNFN